MYVCMYNINYVLYTYHNNYYDYIFKYLVKSLEAVQHVPTTSTVLTAHPFSKCTTILNINTKGLPYQQHLVQPAVKGREFHSSESLNYGTNFIDENHKTVEFKSFCSRDNNLCSLSCKTPRHRIRHSKSLNSLSNDEITRSLHKDYKSFSNLSEEEDYVVSTYFRVPSTDVNGYLKLLSDSNDYEEIDDKSVNIEPDYCIIGGIDAY